jgi:hypothetical protein
MPYLVYMPETNRVLLWAECGQPIHSALVASDDHGKTWNERRHEHRQKNPLPPGQAGFFAVLRMASWNNASAPYPVSVILEP